MASLFVIRGRDQGKRFELNRPVMSIGRDGSNPIQLRDIEVSRKHAELHTSSADCELHDLESSNGTFVNDQRVGQLKLRNGDRIQIGRTLMIYTVSSDESTPGQSPAVDIVAAEQDRRGSQIVHTVAGQTDPTSPLETAPPVWTSRAHSDLQIMYRTALAVSHTLDIDQLLARIMDLIFEWVEADRGCVMLLDQESQQLRPAVRRDRRADDADERIAISRTILEYVMENNQGVVTSDAQDDERWDAGASIVQLGVREAICVPLQGRYGVVGVIYIDTYTDPAVLLRGGQAKRFTEEHLKLMVAIGHQAALAVEDTSYYSAMVQAERLAAIGQAIATLSHHVKNILQGIRGGSYLIEEGLKAEEPEVVRKGWRIVERNQEKISNLVMDMLSFSKEREPLMISAQINEVAGDVCELMEVRAREAGVTLTFEADAEMPLLQFDPDALHRAVLNIVTNAIDACEDGGRVRVCSQYVPQERLCRLIVEDNGLGIAAEDQEAIFSIFESRKGGRGTGLGLPVSQKIMREHEGDIRLESNLGEGSRFVLEMPAINGEEGGGEEGSGDSGDTGETFESPG